MGERLIFVGTGVSTAIPVIGHLEGCACVDAIANPAGPNRRNNVSLLIERPRAVPSDPEPIPEGLSKAAHRAAVMRHQQQLQPHRILIDCGKTFRDAYFRTLCPRGVTCLDAVLITHDHWDALGGVDDLRDLQSIELREETNDWRCSAPLPFFASRRTLDTASKAFGYIMNNSVKGPWAHEEAAGLAPELEAGHEIIMARRVACVRTHEVDDTAVRPMHVPLFSDIPFHTVPLLHGGDYVCLGYVFGRTTRVAYLSDAHAIPAATLDFLVAGPAIDILIVDMLLPADDPPHFSHFRTNDAFDLAWRLQPRRCYGVGMFCSLEHHGTNAVLASMLEKAKAGEPEAPSDRPVRLESIELAYDGLELPVDL